MWKKVLNRVRDLVESEAGAIKRVQDVGLHASARMAANLLGEKLPRGRGELAPWQLWTLRVAQRRICRGEGLPCADEIDAWETTHLYIKGLPPQAREQLGQVLTLFEAGSRLLTTHRRRFTNLTKQAQDEYLESWARSSLPTRRAVLGAVKGVCVVGFWSNPRAWEVVGYDQSQNKGLPTRLRSSLTQKEIA